MQEVLQPGTTPNAFRRWYTRQSRVGRVSLWLIGVILLSLALGHGVGVARGLSTAAIILCCFALSPLLLILLLRGINRRVLWKVRNRLILTYLLMGLAPIVLFGILAAIATYLIAGQYATNTALSLLDQSLIEVTDQTVSAATFSSPTGSRLGNQAPPPGAQAPGKPPVSIEVLRNGLWKPLFPTAAAGNNDASPFTNEPSPAWLHPPFHGIVARKGRLFLCSAANVPQGNTSLTVLGSIPLNSASLAAISQSFGNITVFQGTVQINRQDVDPQGIARGNIDAEADPGHPLHHEDPEFDTVQGGALQPPAFFFDTPVLFSSPVPVSSWETGSKIPALMVVISRPAVLYKRLFVSSVVVGRMVRGGLIGIAILFAALELLALLMAARLSHTITRSIADLHRGTREIDTGNLAHRVRVAQHDQLGDLAASFNGMAASIGDLLLQQREKDRLLTEISIAQEVQTTLFPRSPALFRQSAAAVPGLEMHAVCLPAQSVGGDYFDFIFGPGDALCLSLGDISGKGISAALLMASLHSAVRALSLGCGTGGDAPLSPAKLLGDLNRHLLRSTQAARYATFFFARYDARAQSLTYSNGGHLAPIVLSASGGVRRLDCGGSVVGLLDAMSYAEGVVHLDPGDLLIAFTDGVTEPENGLTEFGEQRLLDLIRAHAILPLPDIMAHTLKAVKDWIGAQEQPDDITLLLARQL